MGTIKKTTIDDVWNIIAELGKAQQRTEEVRREGEKALREAQQRTEEAQQETQEALREFRKETDRAIKAGRKRSKELEDLFTGQWAKLIESLVEGDIINLLQQRNIAVESVMPNVRTKKGNQGREYDLIAKNGDQIVVVEVKTTLKKDDVDDFLKKLEEKFKEDFPEYADRTIYGAVAYLRESSGSATYAERKGLFVIRATGDSASIINRPNFKPKAF